MGQSNLSYPGGRGVGEAMTVVQLKRVLSFCQNNFEVGFVLGKDNHILMRIRNSEGKVIRILDPEDYVPVDLEDT